MWIKTILKHLLVLTLMVGCSSPALVAKDREPKNGWKAFQENRYDVALQEAQAVLSSKPGNRDAHWLAAEATLAAGDTTRSWEHWQAVLADQPEHPRAVLNATDILIERGDLDQAQTILDRALSEAKKPDLPEYLYSQGVLLAAQGNDSEAMVRLSQAVDKNPKQPLFYIALGRVYRGKNVNVLAKDNFQKAIELDPNVASWHFDLADIHMDLKEYNEALEQYKITRDLDSNYPNVYYQIGKLYFYGQKYQQAVDDMEQALANGKEPNFFFHTIYGQALRAVRRLEDAQKQLESAYQLRPDDVETARLLAQNSLDLRQYDRAINALQGIIASDQVESADYSRLGEAYYNLASTEAAANAYYDSATVYLKQGLEQEPENQRLLYLTGMAYFNADQYDSALVYLNDLVKVDSTNFQAYYRLGYSYLKKDQNREAIRSLRQALEVDPSSLPARLMLAHTLSFVDSTRAAKQEFRTILDQDPTNGDAWGALGFIYLKEASNLPDKTPREEKKAAWNRVADQLRKATQYSSKNAAYWVGLGHALYSAYELDEAEAAAKRALALDPNNKDAQNILETINKVRSRIRQ
ncbi:MAG: tetratricopeptide repeat protein [Candidatus Zixiibacteriota bacterium]|nr:MAG: tetratricopeptide repeat protein [candidate division Zixibacteria bacterium]